MVGIPCKSRIALRWAKAASDIRASGVWVAPNRVELDAMKAEQSLEKLKASCEAICRRLGMPLTSLPRFGGPGMSWTVRFVGDTFVSEEEERGEVFREPLGPSQEDALYGIFKRIAPSNAPLGRAPRRNEDGRRQLFRIQEEFLSRVNPEFGERSRKEHEEILKQAPFDDSAGERAELLRFHMEQGLSYWDARDRAHEKFPSPTVDQTNPEDHEVVDLGSLLFLRKRTPDAPG